MRAAYWLTMARCTPGVHALKTNHCANHFLMYEHCGICIVLSGGPTASTSAHVSASPWSCISARVHHVATHAGALEISGSSCTSVPPCAACGFQRHMRTRAGSQRMKASASTHVQVWNVLNTSTTRYLAWAEADAESTTLGVSVSPCAVPAALIQCYPAHCALRTPCGATDQQLSPAP